MGATDIDEWIEIVAKCQYLPENELKVRFKLVLIKAHHSQLFNIETV